MSERAAALTGKRLWVTRSLAQAQGFQSALDRFGGTTIAAATTRIEDVSGTERAALARALLHATAPDWLVFTSATSVRVCQDILQESGSSLSEVGALQVAVVGQATARAAESAGLKNCVRAELATSQGLARLILARESKPAAQILFPRAAGGREEAVTIFRAAGHNVALHTAYRSIAMEKTEPALLAALKLLDADKIDGIAFFAPSQVDALFSVRPDVVDALTKLEIIAAIGPTTAQALTRRGIAVHAIADLPTSEQLVDKIVQAFS